MKLNVYAVFDSKADCFANPFFFSTHGVAIRAFTELANDSKSSINKYPEDFTLFQIAEYEDRTGVITPLKQNHSFGLASSYLRPVVPLKGE